MQALRLKAAAAAQNEASTEVLAEAIAMLRQEPTQYQILSTSTELLRRATLNSAVVPGATLEVCKELIPEKRLHAP